MELLRLVGGNELMRLVGGNELTRLAERMCVPVVQVMLNMVLKQHDSLEASLIAQRVSLSVYSFSYKTIFMHKVEDIFY